MDVLSTGVGASPGVKPFETFGKDSGQAQKAETRDDGPTGPATSKSTREFAGTVRSAPGRDLRMARFIRILLPMARLCRRISRQAPLLQNGPFLPLDLFVCMT